MTRTEAREHPMAKRSRALTLLALLVLIASGSASGQGRTDRTAVFADLLRLYGCVHIVRLIAIDAETSSHGGLIFDREVRRVQDGSNTTDFINRYGLRCGQVTSAAGASPSSRRAFEQLEAIADAMARASIYDRVSPEATQADVALAVSGMRKVELPVVGEIATADVLTAALGPQAAALLREHEAWVRKASTSR